jgi:hypothetical protein
MMFFDDKSDIASVRTHYIRMLGGGSGIVPSLDLGHGVSFVLTATGRVKITWAENPGTFVGFGWGLRDVTQSNVKGFTVTGGVYPLTAGTFTFEVDFWNSTFAAVDLALTNYADLCFTFSELKNP